MMKSLHTPNLVGIGLWGPKIWPHEYKISPIEISVNWPGSKQLGTRPMVAQLTPLSPIPVKGWSHIHEFHGELLRFNKLINATNFNGND